MRGAGARVSALGRRGRLSRARASHGSRLRRRSFEILVGLVGLKLESELELRAVLENEDRVPFASITVRRRPLESGFEPTINPLILTSLGRSGTTWLMKMFASHPAIVVFRRFPYEYSVARYWMHVLRVLSEPCKPERVG